MAGGGGVMDVVRKHFADVSGIGRRNAFRDFYIAELVLFRDAHRVMPSAQDTALVELGAPSAWHVGGFPVATFSIYRDVISTIHGAYALRYAGLHGIPIASFEMAPADYIQAEHVPVQHDVGADWGVGYVFNYPGQADLLYRYPYWGDEIGILLALCALWGCAQAV